MNEALSSDDGGVLLPKKRSSRGVLGAITALILLTVVVFVGYTMFRHRDTPKELMAQADEAFKAEDFEAVEILVNRALALKPKDRPALLMGAQSLEKRERFAEALEMYGKIPDDRTHGAVVARSLAGNIYLNNMHSPYQAEKQFRLAYAQNASIMDPNRFLEHLLYLSARHWERVPFALGAFRLGRLTPRGLYHLSMGSRTPPYRDEIEALWKENPDDPLTLMGMSNIAMFERKYEVAEAYLRKADELALDPKIVAIQAKLGMVYLRMNADEEFLKWHAELAANGNLLADAEKDPAFWFVLGEWANRNNQPKVAIRCFWETLLLDANHQAACYQLGQLLVKEGNEKDAGPFLQRAWILQKYVDACHFLNTRTESRPAQMRMTGALRAARTAIKAKLYWEAWFWYQMAVLIDSDNAEANQYSEQMQTRLQRFPHTRNFPNDNLARNLVDLSSYPLPSWQQDISKKKSPAIAGQSSSGATFQDRAVEAGLKFQYVNGSDPKIRGITRVYHFTGGGVVVLDYDKDGWPDIYFTQGRDVPNGDQEKDKSSNESSPSVPLDRLFRNMGDGHFEDVTAEAGLEENRYSQGASVGDFNNDGFPDLYVANLGANRLYRNNGDGTFSDVSSTAGFKGNFWTTSCMVADVNGDSLPDIYNVNYLDGPQILSTVCRNQSGKKINACMPRQFPASQDRLYLNKGDGSFEDVTDTSGIKVGFGKGLGILAADFDGSGRLSLFVANDSEANFFFVNHTEKRGEAPKFVESALASGLAMNGVGRSEACMGIAAGDADGDGLLDLFVTNFAEESNTFYRQLPGNLFVDETRSAGLVSPSFMMLGFGTQFIDSQLRGSLDLIVTNGHIDVFESSRQFYKMPPQFFQNAGDGSFVEVEAQSLGAYFQGKYLGRGMSKLDWNRDGREDVVISHLDSPAALLTNTTAQTGHHLAIVLVGTASDRDAIGATLTVNAGGRKQVRQLTAGDGYQASNQRLLIFGLGEATRVELLSIRWPSGTVQSFSDLAGDTEYLLIEGVSSPILRRAKTGA